MQREETAEAKHERLTRSAYSRLRNEVMKANGAKIHGEIKAVLTVRDGKVVKVVVLNAAEEV